MANEFTEILNDKKVSLLKSVRETIFLLDCTGYDINVENTLRKLEYKLTKECISNATV